MGDWMNKAIKKPRGHDLTTNKPRKSKGWRKHQRELAWRTRKQAEKRLAM